MAIERLLTGSIQNQIQELMSTEDLVIEAFRDLVKDELKATRAATRLGLRLLPDELQGEVGEALVTLFEKELGALLEKAL